jgi:hypothetical protein
MGFRLYLVWVLNVLDMFITMIGLYYFPEYLYEANGLMRYIVHDEFYFILIKMVYMGLLCSLVYVIYKTIDWKFLRTFFTVASWVLLVEYSAVVSIITFAVIRCSLWLATGAFFILQIM